MRVMPRLANENLYVSQDLLNKITNFVNISYFVADDNLVSYFGTAYSNIKNLRFIKNTGDMPSDKLKVKFETMSSFGTTDIGVYFDSELSPRKTLSTIGTTFELLSGIININDLLDGIHTINIDLRNTYGGTSYQRLTEIYIINT